MMNESVFLQVRTILAWAWQHPSARLYQKKYRTLDYDPSVVQDPDDWETIPFLTKEDLENALWHDLLFTSFDQSSYITYTSGTTRTKQVAVFRVRDPNEKCWNWLTRKEAPAVRRMLFIIPFTILKYHNLAVRYGVMPVMGDIQNLAVSALRAKMFSVDALHTIPTLAVRTASYFKTHYDSLRFKAVSTVGEKVTSVKKTLLKNHYPNATIYSYYSSAETGTMGYQCQVLGESPDGNIYHFDHTKFFPEVIKPAIMTRTRLSQEGELVVTHLRQTATPLIRFRTGDSVVFLVERCACGDPAPLVRIEGRIGFDAVRVAGFELRLESFEEAVCGLDRMLYSQFEVEVSETAQSGAITPHIAWLLLPRQYPLSPAAENVIAQMLMKTTRLSSRYTLEEAVAAGLMAMPAFSFSNTLPDSYKSPGLRLVES